MKNPGAGQHEIPRISDGGERMIRAIHSSVTIRIRESRIVLIWRCVGVLMCFIFAPGTCARADNAPGGAGQDAFHWSPSSKQFLGTAANNNSLVYFTGAQGILTEIF